MKRQKYVYFVSFTFYDNNLDRRFGNTEITATELISSYREIRVLEEKLRRDCNTINDVVVLNYTLLRIEEERS